MSALRTPLGLAKVMEDPKIFFGGKVGVGGGGGWGVMSPVEEK